MQRFSNHRGEHLYVWPNLSFQLWTKNRWVIRGFRLFDAALLPLSHGALWFHGRSGWHENDLAGRVRGHGVRATLRCGGPVTHEETGQERGLVIHCQQITALNHNLHLSDKSLSDAAHTTHEQTRAREYGILNYWPWADGRNFKWNQAFLAEMMFVIITMLVAFAVVCCWRLDDGISLPKDTLTYGPGGDQTSTSE